MQKDINKKRIVLNTFFLYTKTLVTMIIGLYSTRLVLAGLGEVDYGVYGTVGGAIAMLETLNLAMAQATQRFMNYAGGNDDNNKVKEVFNNTILIHIALGFIIALLLLILYFPLFNWIFNLPEERIFAAKVIYLFMIASTFITIVTVPYDAMINANEDFLYYSVVGIFIAVLKLIAAIAVIYYMSDRLILYGILMVAISIVNMLIMRVYCKIKYEECVFKPKQYASKAVAKEIGSFAGWNLVGAFANLFGNHGSTILMNHFFGPILITAKNIGDQICTQVSILTSNMTKALNPVIVKSEGGGDRKSMINLSFLSCRLSFLLYLLVAIPFLFNTKLLLTFWLKDVPTWAVLFCQLQVIRTLFEQLFSPLRMSLMAQGSIKQMNLADLILGLSTLVLLYALYSGGCQAYWHYYISIALLVFASGTIKLFLCRSLCEMSLNLYSKEVLVKCIFTLFTALILAALCTILTKESWFSCCILFTVSGGIIFLCGINNKERSIIIGSFCKKHSIK